ncbi:MAG: V-type ATP synthase subunit D [archaeon]
MMLIWLPQAFIQQCRWAQLTCLTGKKKSHSKGNNSAWDNNNNKMDIKPTRSELIKLKKKIKLAQSGYKLLKKKRDGLILEFFETLKKLKTARKDLTEKYIDAKYKVDMARVTDSDLELKSIALAVGSGPTLNIGMKNVMGVIVPKIEYEYEKDKSGKEGYGLISVSIATIDAISAYQELIEYILLAAEVESSIKKLLEEIDKTKRRVNALEFELIPKMNKAKSFIEFRLEEQERETTFRTKRIKKKR